MSARRVLVLVAIVVGVLPAVPVEAQEGPERYVDRVFDQVHVDRDVVYGAAPDEDGRRQELNVDVYTPVGDDLATRPAIVLAHGGGFVEGTKADMASRASGYARRGFVALSIEYRMDEAAGFIGYPPSAEDITRIFEAKHDMQAAVRWIRARAGTYGIDPQRVAVGGYSAGAVMALLAATTPNDPGSSGTPGVSSKVCTAVSMAGAGEPALVDAGDAGAIFFHGEDDRVVPHPAAFATFEAMEDAGLPASFTTYHGVGHALGRADEIEDDSSSWLVEHVVEPEVGCVGPAVAAHASFVRAAHEDFLDRPATEAEVVQQAGYLDVGGTRATLLGRLTSSDEWLGSIVTGLYRDTLEREPDAGGLAYWIGVLRSGRLTVAQVAASFYASPEYYGRFGPPSNGTTAQWVIDFYDAILGRSPAFEDIDYWVSQAVAHGRSWVAVRIHGSPESRQDRVRALYAHLLDREPEPEGLAFWAGRIATTGDLALARSLAASAEYGALAVERFPG